MKNYQPFVTVIMPVRNEVKFIENSINAILDQSYFKNKIEIIIADGISNDGTYEILLDYENNHDNIFVIQNKEKILLRGVRNESIEIEYSGVNPSPKENNKFF